ncbi:MAG: peptide deformylase [Methylococcales bacterium]|nr:peptide deformylase [Methylococcales bacterium]
MAILPILEFPDERLRKKAAVIKKVDKKIKKLVDDMTETMYEAEGIGLAATQINHHLRLIVIDISENKDTCLCLINPEIIEKEGIEESEEGCLSVPNFFEIVQRAERIKIKALDREGQPYELEAEGLLAVCIQHEMDHLKGTLFVDYLSALKRQRIKTKLEKIHRKNRK